VAAADGEVAGFIILIPRPGYLLLDNVAVLPAAQGQGIGARLLALAEDRAGALHLAQIRLYTNAAMTENLSHYPRHGYTEPTGPPGPPARLPPSLLPQAAGHLTPESA
jgi:GNAT superfamily N-acetyltransferase